MPNYVISTSKGTKVELQNSSVHELKGELKKLRLAHEVVISLIIQTGKVGDSNEN